VDNSVQRIAKLVELSSKIEPLKPKYLELCDEFKINFQHLR
jgi:hypothetical protein